MRRLAKILLVLIVILAIPVLYIGIGCQGDAGEGNTVTAPLISAEARAAADAMPNYRRDEEQAYLTFPERYVVYTSQDYARFIDQRYPSGFSFFTSAGEFWTSYCSVNRHVAPRYAFNAGTHVMIYVIGISHSVEYVVQGFYENTIGRLSEMFAPDPPAAEDLFARMLAKEYGDFLNTIPWYDYPFASRLMELWDNVAFSGDGQVRKIERRFALSFELLVKAGYGFLIKSGRESVYEPEDLEIHALMRHVPIDTAAVDPRIKVDQIFNDATQLVTLPRYQPFTEIVGKLADTNAEFLEIAGNDEILVSVAADDGWTAPPEAGTVLLEVSNLSGGGGKRVALSVPVTGLMAAIRAIRQSGARFEHIYDY
ncbi:MAG: hypothetical protein AB7F76_09025 [Parvibaculaceae bacterium]